LQTEEKWRAVFHGARDRDGTSKCQARQFAGASFQCDAYSARFHT
jgi:hypothetical protein